ncbi:MAG: hypothetical protein WBA97_34960 [Actinophytocola sp.]|uniref:hypothetical protein n=1 Tax=Actinophytocola sp. TaxID=1872138 RepID=UPI003C76455A
MTGSSQVQDNEFPVHKITLNLCEPCINGVGEECHTPGCDLWLHAVDMPILAAQEQVQDEPSAVETVASHLAASAVADAIEGGLVSWGDFPEIGQYDWDAVTTRMRDLVAPLLTDRERFTSAYQVLANRANKEADRG